MSAPVQLVFCGEVLEGFQIDDVRRELGRALRADEPGLKQLFSGRRTVLKRGLALADAQRYVSRLAAMGARVHVEAEPAPAAPVAAAAAPAAAPVASAVPAPPKALALVEAAAPDEVVCPNCGERQSKRLLCRSCGSNIEMAIAAKQEEEARRRAERQAALEARRSSRRRSSGDTPSGERSAWPIGFSFSGRVGRLSSAAANLWLISALLLLTAGFLIQPSLPRALLVGTGVVAVFFFSMRLTVLRCHDCDRHGWWALFVLVPYAGSLASLLFGLVPGNPETNEYGPPPPQGRWRWLGLAVLVLALSVAMLVRSSIRFAERYAEAASRESADEVIDLGGDANISGSSGSGAAALQDAYRDYLRAPGHKVFVASSRQNYAWVGNSDSLDDAARSAMSKCEAQRQPYTPSCRVLNVNNQPVRN